MINSNAVLDVSVKAYDENPERDIRDVMLHLTSEVGEMCDWVKRPHRQKEEFEGECADVIICVIDALYLHIRQRKDYGVSHEAVRKMVINRLNDQIRIKSQKWKESLNADV